MSQSFERLQEIVYSSGMMQSEFATMMGVSVATQRNYEKGLRKPDVDYLTRLYEAGFDVVYLLTGERSVARLSQVESDLLSVWRQADLGRQFAAYNVLVGTAEPPRVESGHHIHYQQGDGGGHTEQGDINHYQGDDKRGSRIRNSIGNITGSVIKNIKQGE